MTRMSKKSGSKKRILDFLLANVGRVIEGEELRVASGSVSEWARRVRELRDEEGYQILTHRDRRDLKPGEGSHFCFTLPCTPHGIIGSEKRYVLNVTGEQNHGRSAK